MKKILTLCIVQQGDQVLLGLKKKGFGEGRWNGFGGKVEEQEDIESAAKRELLEEAGITPLDLKKRGILEFEFQEDPVVLEVHVFHASLFEGEPIESGEMAPQWFAAADIPFESMWPDDKFWLPLLLEGKNFRGRFLFQDTNTLLDHVLIEALED